MSSDDVIIAEHVSHLLVETVIHAGAWDWLFKNLRKILYFLRNQTRDWKENSIEYFYSKQTVDWQRGYLRDIVSVEHTAAYKSDTM